MYLTRRRLQPERMDDPDIDPEELGRALGFLATVNRWLGGTHAVVAQISRWIHRDDGLQRQGPLRVLDVGTGSADLPVALQEWGRRRGIRFEITAIDLHPTTLKFARRNVGDRAGINLVQLDARRLSDRFEPGAFHFSHAGLFLHHLEDIDVMTVLRMMHRLSTHGVIWNDLVRSPLTKAAIWPLALVGPEIFRHDAIASINAGFSKREAIDIAERVGLENVRYRQHFFHRFLLTSTMR